MVPSSSRSVTEPAPHKAQALLPAPSAYRPPEHTSHWPTVPARPGAQGTHPVCCKFTFDPSAHMLHADAPVVLNHLAGHAPHESLGCADAPRNCPAGQASQPVLSRSTSYPAGHVLHSSRPASAYHPERQSMHALRASFARLPAAHSSHRLSAVFGACPRGHVSQESAPYPANHPYGHALHRPRSG